MAALAVAEVLEVAVETAGVAVMAVPAVPAVKVGMAAAWPFWQPGAFCGSAVPLTSVRPRRVAEQPGAPDQRVPGAWIPAITGKEAMAGLVVDRVCIGFCYMAAGPRITGVVPVARGRAVAAAVLGEPAAAAARAAMEPRAVWVHRVW